MTDVFNISATKDTSNYWTINGLQMTNFTPEDLLMYLYKESSSEQVAAIDAALEKDWTLREKLTVLKTSMQRLNKIVVSPRTEVVLNVLNYAKERSMEEV